MLKLKLRSLFRRRQADSDLDEELRFHLESQIELELARGATPAQARANAQRALGNLTLAHEDARATWGFTRLELLLQDLRYTLRSLRKAPGFTLTALATLALALGASTAIFTVVHNVLLEPLSYRDSGRLITIWESVRFLGNDAIGPNLRHVDFLSRHANTLAAVAYFQHGSAGLAQSNDYPLTTGTITSSTNLFEVLAVRPQLGSTFRPEHAVAGQGNVAILTHHLWRNTFQSDPHIIGKTIRLADVPREVIGVLPPDFHFPNRNALRSFNAQQASTTVTEPAIFLPATINMEKVYWVGEWGNWISLARLKPHVTLEQASAELAALGTRLFYEAPPNQRLPQPTDLRVSLKPLQEAMVARSRTALWLLLGAVLSLLLIACVNLANTQLARTFARQRESSVRAALGAPHWRLVAIILLENLVLALTGGAAGLALAAAALRLFQANATIPLPRLDEISLNPSVLAFAFALTVLSALLFSLLPAAQLRRAHPQSALQQGHQRSLGARHGRQLHRWLIALQVFGCTSLLLVTALFAKNLNHLLQQDRGFATAGVALAQPILPASYRPEAKQIAFVDRVLREIRSLPGVESAGYISAMPLEGETWIDGLRRLSPRGEDFVINLRFASPGYFETMRHRLRAGRFFDESDRDRRHIILSENLARAVFGAGDPLGQTVNTNGAEFSVIGVIGDSLSTSLKAAPARLAYVPHTYKTGSKIFLARSRHSAADLVPALRQAIWKHAPGVPIARAKTLDAQVTESLSVERFQTLALVSFGAAALLLAMIGIYGVLSCAVSSRQQELGVRTALGATRRQLYTLTFAEIRTPLLAGLVTGIAASLAASRALQSVVFGAQGFDAALLAGVAALFLLAALTAGYWPARRAASVDPIESLRAT